MLTISGIAAHDRRNTHEYKGKEHAVKVLADGFEYRGTRYGSLSAIAREIAQCSWNGLVFFGLGSKAPATT